MHDVQSVPLETILPLRTKVLRPHLSAGEVAIWEGDRAERTRHWALLDEDAEVLGCATFLVAPAPFAPEREALRLRGMVTAPGRRGEGVGTHLLEVAMSSMAITHAPIRTLWCNARQGAIAFYEKLGFEQRGDLFEVAEIGPHAVMTCQLPMAIA